MPGVIDFSTSHRKRALFFLTLLILAALLSYSIGHFGEVFFYTPLVFLYLISIFYAIYSSYHLWTKSITFKISKGFVYYFIFALLALMVHKFKPAQLIDIGNNIGMLPAIKKNSILFVSNLESRKENLRFGSIIVFKTQHGISVKRVFGTPNDKLRPTHIDIGHENYFLHQRSQAS